MADTLRRDQILDRFPDLSQSEREGFHGEVDRMVGAGWTDSEIRRWLKCTEEVSPELDEKRALRKMREITYQVNQRLKGG